jgi:hypothetical protein
MRALRWAVLVVVLLGLLAGSAWSNHDHRAFAAGVWTLDPHGKPGTLRLAVATKAEVTAKLKAMTDGYGGCDPSNFCSNDPCKGETASHGYVGTFKTPNDHGPVAGCTWAHNGAAYLWFKSTCCQSSGGRKVGRIDMGPNGQSSCATALGYGQCYTLEIKFSHHFDGDGAEEEGKATMVFAAHQFFNEGGDVTVAASAKLKSDKRCKRTRCSLDLEPVARYSGLYTQDDNDFRARFRITQVKVERHDNATKTLVVDVFGFVTDRKGGGRPCQKGARVRIHAALDDGKPTKKIRPSILCGGGSHYFRKYTLGVVGNALSG